MEALRRELALESGGWVPELIVLCERHGESTKNNRRGIGASSQKVAIAVVVMM
jgi:hypothetical protein